MVDYQKLKNFYLHWKNYGNIPISIEVFSHFYNFRTLIYYGTAAVAQWVRALTLPRRREGWVF